MSATRRCLHTGRTPGRIKNTHERAATATYSDAQLLATNSDALVTTKIPQVEMVLLNPDEA